MKNRLLLIIFLSVTILSALEIPAQEEAIPISVSLTGYVENPGVYQITPLNRLSDLLLLNKTAALEQTKVLLEKPKEIEDVDRYEKNRGLRNIQITRAGKTVTYDLLKFYRLGDISQNPLLKDGDVVFVPAIKNFISIGGGINLPGEMEFVEGDQLITIINLALGFTFDADISKVQLYRYQANRIDYDVLNYDLKANPALFDILLKADDRILISCNSEIRTRQRIKIYGQIKYPGEYVIDANTTLYEVLQQAGGLTKRGDLKRLVYYN
jgi:protein involved in polysaccharide export with SLBB domain